MEIRKPSKRNQRLYEKFLKKGNCRNELEYKNCKTLFEAVKKCSKNKLLKYKNNMKKTWEVIKKSIGREKYSQQNFPKKILISISTNLTLHNQNVL